jgi:hypothetical protein
MLIVIVKMFVAATIVTLMARWQYRGRYPTLRDIRLITMRDQLLVRERASTGRGVSMWITGGTFSYHYQRQQERCDSVTTTLSVFFPRSFLRKAKIVLAASFRDAIVEKWDLADGTERTTTNYPDWFALRDILLTVEEKAALQQDGFASAVYQ